MKVGIFSSLSNKLKTYHQQLHPLAQTINLILGIFFFLVGCIFLVLQFYHNKMDVNLFVLFGASFLALWAGVTKSKPLVYVIDLILGLLTLL